MFFIKSNDLSCGRTSSQLDLEKRIEKMEQDVNKLKEKKVLQKTIIDNDCNITEII